MPLNPTDCPFKCKIKMLAVLHLAVLACRLLRRSKGGETHLKGAWATLNLLSADNETTGGVDAVVNQFHLFTACRDSTATKSHVNVY